jgi:hypothetical protein
MDLRKDADEPKREHRNIGRKGDRSLTSYLAAS